MKVQSPFSRAAFFMPTALSKSAKLELTAHDDNN